MTIRSPKKHLFLQDFLEEEMWEEYYLYHTGWCTLPPNLHLLILPLHIHLEPDLLLFVEHQHHHQMIK
jgi:hypothetical protein